MSQNQNQTQFMSAVFNETGKIYIPGINTGVAHTSWGENKSLVLSLMLNLEAFGYTLNRDLAFSLSHMSTRMCSDYCSNINNIFVDSYGMDKKFEPMYPNFPQQVIEASDEELYLNALLHYWGSYVGVRILPNYQKKARLTSEYLDTLVSKELAAINYKGLKEYLSLIMSSNVAYSVSKKENLSEISNHIVAEEGLLEFGEIIANAKIGNKENLAFWGHVAYQFDVRFKEANLNIFFPYVAKKFSTVTDVLRFVAAIAGQDLSLAGKFTVGKLNNNARKTIMKLLELVVANTGDKDSLIVELQSKRSAWIRIAHACHIGTFKATAPNAFFALNALRNNQIPKSFNSMVDRAYHENDYHSLVTLLQKRPGVFARKLAFLLATEGAKYPKHISKESNVEKEIRFKAEALASQKYYKQLKEFNDAVAENERIQNSQMSNALKGLFNKTADSTLNFQRPIYDLDGALKEVRADYAKKAEQRERVTKNNWGLSLHVFSEQEREGFVNAFSQVARDVSTPVLLQLHSHFKNMEAKENASLRLIMPKGGAAKNFIQEGQYSKHDLKACAKVVNIVESVLIARFANLPELGNVYVDPALKKQNIPFAQRSASKTLKTVSRGSRFPMEAKEDTLRMFLWWKQPENQRVDVDVSVIFLDKDYNSVGHCSYFSYRDVEYAHFSGDITSAPNGACEFIDIDLKAMPENVKFAVLGVKSYSGVKFCDMPECFAGWAGISGDAQRGEIYDPRAVKEKVDLSSDSVAVMPLFFDIENMEMVWVDSEIAESGFGHNVSSTGVRESNLVKGWNTAIKPNLYDLFVLHAKARGTLVENAQEADNIYSLYEGVTPYDYALISGEYMADNAIEGSVEGYLADA